MSEFVDATLLRFSQDPFVAGLLNGLGLTAIFNATFDATDIALQSVALGPISARSYKVPAFETVRSIGTDERTMPDAQRVQKERVVPRSGRLEWVDVAFDVVLNTKVQTLVGPLQSVNSQTLEQKLGGVTSIADLRTKLLALYAPSIVDALFAETSISTFDDFERQRHLFIELIGAAPPPFDPNDPAAARDFTVSVAVKITDGFDVSGALQAAKLCRSILEHEVIRGPLAGVERTVPYALVTIFADAAVTDTSLPGLTAAQAKTEVGALFAGERMFAQFIT
ncbi:MAG TPA: hypothetical protein VMS01_14160 [Stellaceae bacterium]|jgi:hypothetical protein|nr:hypothetical protein [Stellaceae bacterium]